MQDGIHFGLDEAVYHAIPRLSASGIQKLLISAGTFWAASWLNPKKAATLIAGLKSSTSPFAAEVMAELRAIHPEVDPEDDDAEVDPEEAKEAEQSTKAQTLGKAFHCARLEPEAFHTRFVRAIGKGDLPKDALKTGAQMAAVLKEMDLKSSGSVSEQAHRLEEAGYDGRIWQLELETWEANRCGRTPIPGKFWDDILADMKVIRETPEIAALLSNGFAEVTILWTDKHGIKMRARLDWLRTDGWVDLKSFSNPMGKDINQCIQDAFVYNRYHVQAASYREAFLSQPDAAPLPICHYVYQEIGTPNLLAKKLRFHDVPATTQANDTMAGYEREPNQPQQWLRRAQAEILKAKRIYRAFSEVYEPGEPWRAFSPVSEMTDMDFRPYWLDEGIDQ